MLVAGRLKTITGEITQLLQGGVVIGGQRQIVPRNAFHDYYGKNIRIRAHLLAYM